MSSPRERIEALEKVIAKSVAADYALARGERVEKEEWWAPKSTLDAMCEFYRNRDWLLRVAKAAVAWRVHVDGMSHESDPCDDCRGCQLIAAVDDAGGSDA